MNVNIEIPDECNGDLEITYKGVIFKVKIRQMELAREGSPFIETLFVLHVSAFPLISKVQYNLICDENEQIAQHIIREIATLRDDVGEMFIVNMCEWFEFIQY